MLEENLPKLFCLVLGRVWGSQGQQFRLFRATSRSGLFLARMHWPIWYPITFYVLRTILCDTKELGDANFSVGIQNLYLVTGFYIYLWSHHSHQYDTTLVFVQNLKLCWNNVEILICLLHSFIFLLFIHKKYNITW